MAKFPQEEFPSLYLPRTRPHAWIQWKGTNVCMDMHCECGHHSHFDAASCYHIKCPGCGQVYECDGHITLHKLDFQPDMTVEAEFKQDQGRKHE